MLLLDMSRDAQKFIAELDAKRFKQVVNKIFELASDPRPNDSAQLKGYDNLYRVGVGEYRIIYRFDDTTVVIALVDKRNDDQVYRTLSRKP